MPGAAVRGVAGQPFTFGLESTVMFDTKQKTFALVLSLVIGCGLAGCTREESSPPPAAPLPDVMSTVGLELAADVSLGALQLDIDYGRTTGAFVGNGDQVECETLPEGALSSYNHLAETRVLKAAFVAVKGVDGPVRFAECRFRGAPSADAIRINVIDASAPDLAELSPPPEIKVVVTAD